MWLTKHHGSGNDFLILLDPRGLYPVTADMARAACDRHLGVGADGLIRATPGRDGAEVTMELRNADGSLAEMSGNGVGCLAQAVINAGLGGPHRVVVATPAGIRTVDVVDRPAARTHRMRVAMGPAVVGDERPEWLDDDIIRAVHVDVGNPHLVLHAADPEAKTDLAERGRAIDAHTPGGINVEVVTVGPGDGELTMAVYERGVGVTRACGTGACAAAAAARAWELAGDRVRVRTPGGFADVELAGAAAFLTTPVVAIAGVDFHWP